MTATAILLVGLGSGVNVVQSETTEGSSPPSDSLQWPRTFSNPQGKIIVYHPTLETWNEQTLTSRTAVAVTPAGADKAEIGAIFLKANTVVDKANRTVLLTNIAITKAHFPGAKDPAAMEALVKEVLPQEKTISLDRLLAGLKLAKEQDKKAAVTVKNPVPKMIVSDTPAILVLVQGQPNMSDVPGTDLKQIINTNWVYLVQESANAYWLLNGKQWLTMISPTGSWTESKTPPPGLGNAPAGSALAKAAKETPETGKPVPAVYIENEDAALLVFEGEPKFEPVQDTGLLFATNSEDDVFQVGSGEVYVLLAGRWFKAGSMDGPWAYVAPNDLPKAFAQIPPDSPASRVMASVPGTAQAQESVILASIPTTATVKRSEAKVDVTYAGQPEFVSIQGTSMKRAVNTSFTVIEADGKYYVCENAVWFVSASPNGPWKVADTVPEVVYTIPPSDPAYPVTYVYVYGSDADYVQTGYTAGYVGGFITGALIVYGTGWYYSPWYSGRYWYGHPWVYGRGAYYNPWTGGWAYRNRWATPYYRGGRAGAYNPWTGNYAYGRREVTPYGAWGKGTIGNVDGRWAQGGYHVGPRGAVAGYHNSSGDSGWTYRTRNGEGGAAKVNNNIYAGRDGNVYKRENGNWYKDNGGNWNQVQRPAGAPDAATTRQNVENRATDLARNNEAAQRVADRQATQQRVRDEVTPATPKPTQRTEQVRNAKPLQQPQQFQNLERNFQNHSRADHQYNQFRSNRQSFRNGGGNFRGGGRGGGRGRR